MVLKPIGLTFMQYEEGNLLSLALAYASLFPVFIVVGFAAVLFVRRELHTGTFFVGQLACEVLTILLKSVIKEPRPPGKEYIIDYNSATASLQYNLHCHGDLMYVGSQRDGYGMPSEHTSFMFFFATYITLFLWKR
jgi:dolichyldiphosphatase